MMTADDCIRKAFQALLRGDTAERDRLCALAKNILAVQERLERGYPATEAIITIAPICLPDRSNKPPSPDR